MAIETIHGTLRQKPVIDSTSGAPEVIVLKHRDARLYHEQYFDELLTIEKKRCERWKARALLMLVDLSAFQNISERHKIARRIMDVLSNVTRETDVKGWHVEDSIIGVLFTETAGKEATAAFIPGHIASKCEGHLNSHMGAQRFPRIEITWHVFPEEFPRRRTEQEPKLLAIGRKRTERRVGLGAKRLIDVMGGIFAMALLAPVLGGIAILVKVTSEGPVLFKQERIGLGGKRFMLLKFRTMFANDDASIHREFEKNLVCGVNGAGQAAGSSHTCNIKGDPRLTLVGRQLRKTGLDELPQFINVLKGDMSLVGPRPPIMHEREDCDVWQRDRVLDMRPGITGLWQVTGRSVAAFDEMTPLDIRYVRQWSLWLDTKIILKTLVMVMGGGAY
jgi:lipopolysaccharide/colanic/teichoic acid biosynthesis glycosyltransferase